MLDTPRTYEPAENYADLPYAELKAIRDSVSALMAEKLEAEKVALLEEISERAAKLGFDPLELISRNSTAKQKYRHPDNSTLTWSGRGRPPAWLLELEENGQNRDNFKVL